MEISLKILPHAEGLALPHYATSQSAGMDLLAAVQTPLTIAPHHTALVPTGLCLALPAGYEAQVRPRSGLALKNAVTVLNSPGTIDADYRGEVSVILINHSTADFVIERGMRIAQMVIAKHETTTWNVVQDLDETARGTGGFGSTGVKSA